MPAAIVLSDVTLSTPDGRLLLSNVDLSFGPGRTGLVGRNGVGKTTLLRAISSVSVLDSASSIRDNFRRLNPHSDENACRAALARFMFRADAALADVSSLSGGQLLRAGLACVLGGTAPPQLLILDEPTNHLDIEAVEAVEAGLRAYDGALLVVSHDEAFLRLVGISRRLALPSQVISPA